MMAAQIGQQVQLTAPRTIGKSDSGSDSWTITPGFLPSPGASFTNLSTGDHSVSFSLNQKQQYE
jgi:hypothetical protein